MRRRALLAGTALLFVAGAAAQTVPDRFYFAEGKIRVLIVTGRNNHDWRSTTPYLRRVLDLTGKFDVRVTETPDGLTAETLKAFRCSGRELLRSALERPGRKGG